MQQERPHVMQEQTRSGRMLGLGLIAVVAAFGVAGVLWSAFAAQQMGGGSDPVYPQLVAVQPKIYGEAHLPERERLGEIIGQTNLLREAERERFRRYIMERPMDQRAVDLSEQGKRLVQTAVRLHREDLLPQSVVLTSSDLDVAQLEDPKQIREHLALLLTYEDAQKRDRAAQMVEHPAKLTVNFRDAYLLLIGSNEQALRKMTQSLAADQREIPERYQQAFELNRDEGIFYLVDTHSLWNTFLDELGQQPQQQQPQQQQQQPQQQQQQQAQQPRERRLDPQARARLRNVLRELLPPDGVGIFAHWMGIEQSEYRLPVRSEELDRSQLFGDGGSELAEYMPANAGFVCKLSLFKGPIEEGAETPILDRLRQLEPLLDEIDGMARNGMGQEQREQLRRHIYNILEVSEGNLAFAAFPPFGQLPGNVAMTLASQVTDGQKAYERMQQLVQQVDPQANVQTTKIGERPAMVVDIDQETNLCVVFEENTVIYLLVPGEKLQQQVVQQYVEGIQDNSLAGRGVLDQIQKHNVSFDHTLLTAVNMSTMMEIYHDLHLLGIKTRMMMHRKMQEGQRQQQGEQQQGGQQQQQQQQQRESISIVRQRVQHDNPLANRWLAESVQVENGLHGYANYGLREQYALMFLHDYLMHQHRTRAMEALDRNRLQQAMRQFVQQKRQQGETSPTQYWEDEFILMLDESSQKALLPLKATPMERKRIERDTDMDIPAEPEEFEAKMRQDRQWRMILVNPRTNEPMDVAVPIEGQ